MKERNTATHGSAYTPNMDTPERTRRSNRALGGLLLTLLLPPIGIAYLWRRGVFRTRGRVLLSCVATIEMAVLLALQFVPFWTVEDTQVSIGGYVWFPSDHKDLESQFSAQFEDYTINDTIVMPILILVLAAVGIVLCIVKVNSPLCALLPAACGLVGTIGYLIQPVFRLGSGWALHCLVSVAMLAVAAVTLATGLRRTMRG